MKKCIFLFVIVCIIFIGCNSEKNDNSTTQINELNETITSLKGEKSTLEQDKKIDESIIEQLKQDIQKLEEENFNLRLRLISAKKDEINIFDSSLYINHDIDYALDFKYDGFNTKVYITPSTDEEIYTIQKKDVFHVSNIINVIANNKIFVKGKTDNGIEGFIELRRNPYKNGDFEPIETLVVDGIEIQTLKLDSSFNVSDGINIKELPSETSKNLHEITHKEGSEYYKSTEITSDYKWVKIQLGDFIGWAPASALSRDIGGPTIYTPETTIYWELIGSNEI